MPNYLRVGVEYPPYDSKRPSVNFNQQDLPDSVRVVNEKSILKDYSTNPKRDGVYQAWIPWDEIPSPEFDDDDGYPWEDFNLRNTFPPAKIEVGDRGQMRILDGNHRIHYWLENGMDYIPCWVIDNRGKNGVWEGEEDFNRNPDPEQLQKIRQILEEGSALSQELGLLSFNSGDEVTFTTFEGLPFEATLSGIIELGPFPFGEEVSYLVRITSEEVPDALRGMDVINVPYSNLERAWGL